MDTKTRNRIEYWVDRLIGFDHFYMYSDSYEVWVKGAEKKKALIEEIKEASLSDFEKTTILQIIGIRSDARYKEAHIKYDCIAVRPLWDEKDGPDLKHACVALLN